MKNIIDLRSDTVTRPTPLMRKWMMKAEVGDDVYGEDPTVNLLQTKMCELLGKEQAIFVPSGTCANQIAIGLHCSPGEEIICHEYSHIYRWEGGGMARLWGVTPKIIYENKREYYRGYFTREDLEAQMVVNPRDIHFAQTKLVSLENTLNRCGGKIYPLEEIKKIADWAKSHQLKMHLDGARLWNAVIATQIPLKEWAQYFDTISLCFSKGLGAPVGAVLVGDSETLAKASSLRKVLGGGMRQAGLLAAGCLYAIENHWQGLSQDHHHAQLIAQAVRETQGLSLEYDPVETNMVWVKVDSRVYGRAASILEFLKKGGILVSCYGTDLLRFCTHLDISLRETLKVVEVIQSLPSSSLSSSMN